MKKILIALLLFCSPAYAQLQIGQKARVQSVSANYNLTEYDDVVLVDATAAQRSIVLPNPAVVKGKIVTIKKTDTGTNWVVITSSGGSLIDGLSTQNLVTSRAWIKIVSSGTAWAIDSSSAQPSSWASLYYSSATNCLWTHTNGFWTTYSNDNDCATAQTYGYASTVAGAAGTSGNKIPGITVSYLPPGEYEVQFKGRHYAAGPAGNVCNFQIVQSGAAVYPSGGGGTGGSGYSSAPGGSTADGLNALFIHIVTSINQSNILFQARATNFGAASPCSIDLRDTAYDNSYIINVYRYPVPGHI